MSDSEAWVWIASTASRASRSRGGPPGMPVPAKKWRSAMAICRSGTAVGGSRHSVSVTFWSDRGASGLKPLARASSSASSWRGMMSTIGARSSAR